MTAHMKVCLSMLGLASLAVCLGLVARASGRSPSSAGAKTILAKVRDYQSRGLYADPTPYLGSKMAAGYLDACVASCSEVLGRKLAGIRINTGFSPDSINLFFFKDDPDECFVGFHNNAASIGLGNVIVVDYSAFFGRSPRPTGGINDLYREFLWLWPIGHEIGHIAYGHSLTHFAIRDNREVGAWSIGKRAQQEQEDAADKFALSAVKTPEQQRAMFLCLETAADGVHRKALEDGKAKALTDATVVTMARGDSHKPLVIRVFELRSMFRAMVGWDEWSESKHKSFSDAVNKNDLAGSRLRLIVED